MPPATVSRPPAVSVVLYLYCNYIFNFRSSCRVCTDGLCLFSCDRLGATISVLRTKVIEGGEELKNVAEVLVRKVPENQQVIESVYRVCLVFGQRRM